MYIPIPTTYLTSMWLYLCLLFVVVPVQNVFRIAYTYFMTQIIYRPNWMDPSPLSRTDLSYLDFNGNKISINFDKDLSYRVFRYLVNTR